MFESMRRAPRGRAARVGIATAALAVAGGVVFVSQAGAAGVNTKNVMIKAPSGIGCTTVMVHGVSGRELAYNEYDYQALHWDSAKWNSTGMSAPVGGTVEVWLHEGNCRTVNYGTVQKDRNAKTFKVAGNTVNAWIDDSSGPVIPSPPPHPLPPPPHS